MKWKAFVPRESEDLARRSRDLVNSAEEKLSSVSLRYINLFEKARTIIIIRTDKMIAAVLDLVIVWMTATQGCPVGEARSSSKLPKLNMKVIAMRKPRT